MLASPVAHPFPNRAFLTRSLTLLLILPLVTGTFQVFAYAQSGLDDVHVTSRSAIAEASIGSSGLTSGVHVIREDVNLVLVPVSVVDPMQRIVVGLQSNNFQVFEGRKAQAIRHFSSEDAPVSIGHPRLQRKHA